MTENEAIKAIEHDLEWHSKELQPKYKEVLRYAIKALEEIQQYRAIGTVEEVKEAKDQFDNINSVAEKTALIGLSDYGTAKEAVITEMKRNLDCSLKEYQSIGTVEEFKALKEKATPKKLEIEKFWGYDDLMCPNCKSYKIKNPKYCCDCGQKLDWQ